MIKNYFLKDIRKAYFFLTTKKISSDNFIIVRIIFILNNKYLPYAKYCAKCCFIEINKHVPFSQEVCNLKSDQEASDMLLLKPRPGQCLSWMQRCTKPHVVILLHKHTNDLLDIRWFLQGHTRCVVESELEVWCTWPQSLLSCCPWTDSHFRLPVRFLWPLKQRLVNSWTLSLLLSSPFIPFLSSCYPIPICKDFRTYDSLKCAHSNYAEILFTSQRWKGIKCFFISVQLFNHILHIIDVQIC